LNKTSNKDIGVGDLTGFKNLGFRLKTKVRKSLWFDD